MGDFSHLIELAAVFGGITGFCVWQLITVSRLTKINREKEGENGETSD
jgi:hypothetical protein